MIEEIDALIGPDQGVAPGLYSQLTRRERQILEHIARGSDNLQIAAHLDLAEKTVRNHVTAIFSKMGVESRAQAIVQAREAGLADEPRR
jgi:DNA-binding NarL/FixJ family response regulator